MKSLIVIAVIFSLVAAEERTWRARDAGDARDAGLPFLQGKYKAAMNARVAAREAVSSSNATCVEKYKLAVNSCRSCASDMCIARVNAVCQYEDTSELVAEIQRPYYWQMALGTIFHFTTEDVPDFLLNTVPDVLVNIGGGLLDAVNTAGNYLGGGIVDVGSSVGGGFVDLGNSIGLIDAGSEAIDFGEAVGTDIVHGVVGATNAVEDVAVESIKTIAHGADAAVNEIGNLGSDAVNTVGGFFGFGKRSVRMRREAQAEPGCSDFQSDATACQFYLNPTYCSSCAFDISIDCPQYVADVNNARKIFAATSKLASITTGLYMITEIKYDTANYDSETRDVRDAVVKANVFGTDVTFTVAGPINEYDPKECGTMLARKALEAFMSA